MFFSPRTLAYIKKILYFCKQIWKYPVDYKQQTNTRMKKKLFLTGLVLCLSSAIFAEEDINILDAYKGSLSIDSAIVTDNNDAVLQKALYQYDEQQNMVGVQVYNYDEYSDSLILSQNTGFEKRGDTIVEKYYEYDEYSDSTYYRFYHEYCTDNHGNLTYNALFSFHDWIGDNGMWASERIEHMTYDEQSRLTVYRLEHFDYSTQSGNVLESITYYTYPSDSVREETKWEYDASEDHLLATERREYRTSGDSILEIYYTPDYQSEESDAWELYYINAEIHHTPDSMTTYSVYAAYEWQDEKRVFTGLDYQSRDRIVTGDHKKTIYTDHYEEGEWHIAYKEVFYYDAGGRTTSRTEYYWNSETNKLQPGRRYVFQYHSNGRQTTYLFYWNEDRQDWEPADAPARQVMSEEYIQDAMYRMETTKDEDGSVLIQKAYLYNEETELWDIFAYSRTYTYYLNGTAILSGITTAIPAITPAAATAMQKVILNGQIYIMQGSSLYSIQGQRIQ